MAKSSHSRLSPRQELLKIEKRLYEQNQQTIRDSTNVSDANFKKYYHKYKRAIASYTKAVDVEALEADIAASSAVIMGDYHTLDQSQRSFMRTLRNYFRRQNTKVIVALEAVQARHQKPLTAYMNGDINEEAFIKKIGFRSHWFFDLWANYTVIFDFLKYHKIPTFGIDMSGADKHPLADRDKFMAQKIMDLHKKYPEHVIFVLVGDMHLAPEHLPRELGKLAKTQKSRFPLVTLFQNSPAIYFKLSEKEVLDHTLVVKMAPHAYCRMHTPPLIVQQSYINWLYHEDGHFDWVDARGSFLHIVQQQVEILKLPLPPDYENVEVYTCGDLGFMKLDSFKKKFSKTELAFIKRQLLGSESYFMSRARIVYIANVSINHAAEEAGHYLKHLFSGEELARTHKDAFYANVLHEAIGFFCSKIINGRRKCAHVKDFRSEISYLTNAGLCAKLAVPFETAQLFLKHKKMIEKGDTFHTNLIAAFSPELFLSVSHALGYDLGDHLYYGFMDGCVQHDHIVRLFQSQWAEEGEPVAFYADLLAVLRGVKRPPKI